MKKVLLTGASGFIGRHCITPLVNSGYEVHCISTRNVNEQSEGVYWHKADLLKTLDVSSLVSNIKPESLLHLAWHMQPGDTLNDPCNIEWIEKSLSLLRVFKDNGGERAVIAGTCYEYDLNDGFLLIQ